MLFRSYGFISEKLDGGITVAGIPGKYVGKVGSISCSNLLSVLKLGDASAIFGVPSRLYSAEFFIV